MDRTPYAISPLSAKRTANTASAANAPRQKPGPFARRCRRMSAVKNAKNGAHGRSPIRPAPKYQKNRHAMMIPMNDSGANKIAYITDTTIVKPARARSHVLSRPFSSLTARKRRRFASGTDATSAPCIHVGIGSTPISEHIPVDSSVTNAAAGRITPKRTRSTLYTVFIVQCSFRMYKCVPRAKMSPGLRNRL